MTFPHDSKRAVAAAHGPARCACLPGIKWLRGVGFLLPVLFMVFHGSAAGLPGIGGTFDTGRASSLAALLSEFLTDSRPFIARAELTVGGAGESGLVKVPMTVSMASGRSRWNVNLSDASGVDETTGELLVQMKLSRLALIVQPDRTRVILPDAGSFADMTNQPNSGIQLEAGKKITHVQKAHVGREVVNGLACLKYKVTVPDGKGGKQEAHVWEAEKLNGLPVRFEARQDGTVTALQFFDVKLANPDPRAFDTPAQYTRHASIESLLQSALLSGFTLGE